jgi:hypothetical protein
MCNSLYKALLRIEASHCSPVYAPQWHHSGNTLATPVGPRTVPKPMLHIGSSHVGASVKAPLLQLVLLHSEEEFCFTVLLRPRTLHVHVLRLLHLHRVVCCHCRRLCARRPVSRRCQRWLHEGSYGHGSVGQHPRQP